MLHLEREHYFELNMDTNSELDKIDTNTDEPISLSAGSSGRYGMRPSGMGFNSPPSYQSTYTFATCAQNQTWSVQNTFMSSYNSRIRSFKNWPKQIRQTPEELALSGFYYHSEGDFVYCFYCGVAIHDWETCDNVHFEHRRHSPFCKYLDMICEY